MKTLSFVLSLAVLALGPPAAAQPAASGPPTLCQDSDQGFAQNAQAMIAAGIDAARATFAPDAPRLKPDQDLAQIARRRACDMAHGKPLSHTDAQGRFIADDMVRARFGPYGTAGETIMEMDGKRPFGSAQFARATVESWMGSPDYRGDILDPAFAAGGVGVAKLGDQAIAVLVLYGQPEKQNVVPCQGQDQAFAQKAAALIAAGIDAARAKFAPDAPPLEPDPELARIAQTRSCHMALGQQPFAHEDLEGHFIAGDMVKERFGPYGAIGENITRMGSLFPIGTRPFSPEAFAHDAVDGWMKSPEHRANILNPRFDASGIGVAMVGDQAFATQIFHGPPRVRKRDDKTP